MTNNIASRLVIPYIKNTICSIFILFIVPVLLLSSVSALAQEDSSWSPQQRIPGYSNANLPPILIADQKNSVHAFFSQRSNLAEDQIENAVMYNMWSIDRGWSKPVDVLSSPLNSEIRILDAFLDRENTVHLVFWSQKNINTNIYYASAKINKARYARAWSTPILVAENAQDPENGAFYIDETGNYNIVFVSKLNGSSIRCINSQDKGNTWSDPVSVSSVHDTNNLINNLSISIEPTGSVDAIWNEITKGGQGRSIYFAQKKFDVVRWKQPVLLASADGGYGTNTPAVFKHNDSIFALYNLGGKLWQRRSSNGIDWSPPMELFSRYVGVNGSLSLVVDGSDILHLFFGQRITGSPDIHGMWESQWIDNQWSSPAAVTAGPRIMSGDNRSFDPFDARAVVSQGNVILVTWHTDPGNGEQNENGVWYSYTKLNISPSPSEDEVTTAITSPTREADTTQIPATPGTTPGSNQPLSIATMSKNSGNMSYSLLIGVIPSIFIILIILTISIFIRRTK